ncbi:bacterial Ig-like domain-containing protein, partial [Enterococcus hirae]|nr:bacterial Ig-like domain-containing protein [Enterococcus hirae]
MKRSINWIATTSLLCSTVLFNISSLVAVNASTTNGMLDVSAWTTTVNGDTTILTGYTGQDKDVVIPLSGDVGTTNVKITKQALRQAATEADSQGGTLSTSTNDLSGTGLVADNSTDDNPSDTIVDYSGTFKDLTNITKIDLSPLKIEAHDGADGQDVKGQNGQDAKGQDGQAGESINVSSMFENCTALKEIDLSSFVGQGGSGGNGGSGTGGSGIGCSGKGGNGGYAGNFNSQNMYEHTPQLVEIQMGSFVGKNGRGGDGGDGHGGNGNNGSSSTGANGWNNAFNGLGQAGYGTNGAHGGYGYGGYGYCGGDGHGGNGGRGGDGQGGNGGNGHGGNSYGGNTGGNGYGGDGGQGQMGQGGSGGKNNGHNGIGQGGNGGQGGHGLHGNNNGTGQGGSGGYGGSGNSGYTGSQGAAGTSSRGVIDPHLLPENLTGDDLRLYQAYTGTTDKTNMFFPIAVNELALTKKVGFALDELKENIAALRATDSGKGENIRDSELGNVSLSAKDETGNAIDLADVSKKAGKYTLTYTYNEKSIDTQLTVKGGSITTQDLTLGTGDAWKPADNFVSAENENQQPIPFDQLTVTGADQVDLSKAGTYTVSFSYQDVSKTLTADAKVNVIDIQT